MSFLSANTSYEDYRQNWDSKQGLWLTDKFCNFSHFLCRLRMQMRFGELTRARLTLLRLELVGESLECEWLARSPDVWDAHLPRRVALRHASLQALRDAIDIRTLVFHTFSCVEEAHLRIYRESQEERRELIITGCVQRNDNASRWVHSLTMRAKVLGFRFQLEDEILRELPGAGKPLTPTEFKTL